MYLILEAGTLGTLARPTVSGERIILQGLACRTYAHL